MAVIQFRDARKRIAAVWLIMAGLAFVLMIAQSFLGAFGAKTVQAWGWFLGNTMPTISVVIANLVTDARGEGDADRDVDRFYYRLTLGACVLYLSTLFATLLGWRLTRYHDPLEVMGISSLWIAPLQGVVVSMISIFFRKSAKPAGRRKSAKSEATGGGN